MSLNVYTTELHEGQPVRHSSTCRSPRFVVHCFELFLKFGKRIFGFRSHCSLVFNCLLHPRPEHLLECSELLFTNTAASKNWSASCLSAGKSSSRANWAQYRKYCGAIRSGNTSHTVAAVPAVSVVIVVVAVRRCCRCCCCCRCSPRNRDMGH